MEVLELQSATRRNCLEQKMPRGVAWRRAWAQAGDSQGGTQEKGGARVSVRRGGVGCGPGEGDPRDRLRAGGAGSWQRL